MNRKMEEEEGLPYGLLPEVEVFPVEIPEALFPQKQEKRKKVFCQSLQARWVWVAILVVAAVNPVTFTEERLTIVEKN